MSYSSGVAYTYTYSYRVYTHNVYTCTQCYNIVTVYGVFIFYFPPYPSRGGGGGGDVYNVVAHCVHRKPFGTTLVKSRSLRINCGKTACMHFLRQTAVAGLLPSCEYRARRKSHTRNLREQTVVFRTCREKKKKMRKTRM